MALRIREVHSLEQAAGLRGVVVGNRCLEPLAPRRRLAQLTAQPAEKAHGGLVGHGNGRLSPMDTLLAIASRREVRDYEPRALPREVEERILDAGRLSGSSKNRQPWRFHVVPGELLVDAVYEPTNLQRCALRRRDRGQRQGACLVRCGPRGSEHAARGLERGSGGVTERHLRRAGRPRGARARGRRADRDRPLIRLSGEERETRSRAP